MEGEKQPVKITKALCKSCKYSARISGRLNNSVQQSLSCNYILDEEKSRIFDKNGNMRFPKGYCGTYEPKNGTERSRKPKYKLKKTIYG